MDELPWDKRPPDRRLPPAFDHEGLPPDSHFAERDVLYDYGLPTESVSLRRQATEDEVARACTEVRLWHALVSVLIIGHSELLLW